MFQAVRKGPHALRWDGKPGMNPFDLGEIIVALEPIHILNKPVKRQLAFTGDHGIDFRKQLQNAGSRIRGKRRSADHRDQSGMPALYFFYKIE